MAEEPIEAFKFLTKEDLKILFEGSTRRTCKRGDYLFREGELQPNLYVVNRGWVRIERNYRGQGLAVARYGPGNLLGEVAFLEQRYAFGSAIAEEDVEVDVLDGQMIQSKLATQRSLKKLDVDDSGKINVLALFQALEDALSPEGFAERFYHSLALLLGRRLRQVLPGIGVGEASPRLRMPRTVELSPQQFPKGLIDAMDSFTTTMSAATHKIDAGKMDNRSAGNTVAECCENAVKKLNEFTDEGVLEGIATSDLNNTRDVPELARSIGSYVFRETFAVFMQSATIALGYEKPGGRAAGREFLERVEKNEADGDGRVGVLVDEWFLARPLCQAHRNSLRMMTALLRQTLKDVPRAEGSGELIRVTSLMAGTATEIFDLLSGEPQKLLVTCLDGDADTTLANDKISRQLKHDDCVTFLRTNLVDVVRGETMLALEKQHVIYGLGLCDQLEDKDFALLLNWAHDHLLPGGWLILTNRDSASPDRALTESILDWPVWHRSQEDLSDLFAASPFGRVPEFSVEEAKVNIFARCRKG